MSCFSRKCWPCSSHQPEEPQEERSALNQRDDELNSLRNRNKEVKEQLNKTRSALKEQEEELKSFKDRVAVEVALPIQTGKTESMNSPVSKTRLKEMYDELRLNWLNVKNHLKSKKENSDSVRAHVQKMFETAAKEMEERKRHIDRVFRLSDDSCVTPPRARESRQSATQSLQLLIYQSRKETVLQALVPVREAGKHQDVMLDFAAECCWLRCLMALNSPPLQPDWQNHDPGMDTWNILPRDIKVSDLQRSHFSI